MIGQAQPRVRWKPGWTGPCGGTCSPPLHHPLGRAPSRQDRLTPPAPARWRHRGKERGRRRELPAVVRVLSAVDPQRLDGPRCPRQILLELGGVLADDVGRAVALNTPALGQRPDVSNPVFSASHAAVKQDHVRSTTPGFRCHDWRLWLLHRCLILRHRHVAQAHPVCNTLPNL